MTKKLKETRQELFNSIITSTQEEKNKEFALSQYLEEAENTTRSEITAMKKQIHEADNAIQAIYKQDTFSASDLYNELAKKELLERKLKGLNKILKELF